MDRRQRKTRQAIFQAFIALLSRKSFHQITVAEIIEQADIGRATFYAHFETKEFLLKALNEELFCHLFDRMQRDDPGHTHIFACDASGSVFLHLLRHLQKNDNRILDLLVSENNALFLQYFKEGLCALAEKQMDVFDTEKAKRLPRDFWIEHIADTFIQTVKWWLNNHMQESAETVAEYFYLAV